MAQRVKALAAMPDTELDSQDPHGGRRKPAVEIWPLASPCSLLLTNKHTIEKNKKPGQSKIELLRIPQQDVKV